MSGTTTNQRLLDWVAEWAEIMQPADIYWCDGSAEEYDRLCQALVDSARLYTSPRGSSTQTTLQAGLVQSGGRSHPCGARYTRAAIASPISRVPRSVPPSSMMSRVR